MKRGGFNGMNSPVHHGGAKKWHRAGTPVLTYFDIAGLANYTRMLFTIGDVDFVDRRITREEFDEKFQKYSPSGQLPILEVGDDILTQSSAIALYAASKANLLIDDPVMMAKALSIQSILDELRSEAAVEGTKYEVMEERYKHLGVWFAEQYPEKFAMINKVLETIPATTGSPYICGKMSFVDVLFATMMKQVRDWLGEEHTDKIATLAPRAAEAAKAVMALPAWQKVTNSYTPPKLTLYYFNTDGRATPIRWALAYGRLEYEEKTFGHDEWASTYKAMSPTGRAPWMTIESACGKVETIAETNAILAYVGSRTKLIPRNPLDASHMYGVIQSADNVTDMLVTVWHMVHRKKPEEEKQAMIKHLNGGVLAKAVKRLEDHVKLRLDHTGFVVGGRMTLADFVVAATFRFINGRHHGLVVDNLFVDYPSLLRVFQRVMQHQELQLTLADMKAKPTVFYFDLPARGAVIKFMLNHGEIEHNWVTFDQAGWANQYKKATKTGKCPYMDINGKLIYEVIGCVKYVAERANLMPIAIENRVAADALFSIYNSVIDVMRTVYVFPEGEERVLNIQKKTPEFEVPMNVVEQVVATTQSAEGYIVENHLTWIDFYIAAEVEWACVRGWITSPIQDKWPHLAKTHKLVYGLPCTKC